MVRVKNVLDTWKAIRQDSATAVEEFPAADLDFRPVPEMQSFREIARHILDASDGLIGVLADGETDFSNPAFRPRMKNYLRDLPADASGANLAAALRQSMDAIAAKLEAKPAEFFATTMKRIDGQEITRLEMVQFVKEHELTHRQQLFVYLRLKGLTPATTRRRLARQAAK